MKRSKFVMPLISLVFSLLLIEGMLQLAALANPRIALLLSPGIPREIPDPVLGSRPNPAMPDHDERGYRNPVALDRADVVTLGDSQTYGSEVSRANAWPTLLGENLATPTYNISLGGWGPAHYYLVADEALALQPKVLIVALYAGNDLADAYRTLRRTDVPTLAQGSPYDAADFATADEQLGPVGMYWRETRAKRRGAFKTATDAFVKPFEEHCKIWGLIRGLSRIESAEETNMKTDSVRDDIDKYARKIDHLPPDYYFPFRTGEVGTVFTPLGRKAVGDVRDPRIAEGLRISLASVAQINRRCAGECRLVVVTIPTKEYAFSEAVAASGVDAPPAYRELVEAERALWQSIGNALDRLGIPVIDARVPLVRSIREGVNPYLADWDGHPNMAGNRAIADYVAAQPMLQSLKR